ncbi:hypothetical protein [Rhodothalassium salexigens]|uniref:hypothetical protein n=1 Tax=Rhodothalassium salexigens TaxID=1086 RepID=UPI0010496456|nr:hypothetical protein [Rhodothalassium salexigens]MBB4211053.1 hypothetical protein [Rhodothalassium salexigens DSM 2132]
MAVSEREITIGVMRLAAQKPDNFASFTVLYQKLPEIVRLDQEDWEGSDTRNGEPMWYQIVRNIKCHYESEGNAIHLGWLESVPSQGYKLTAKGREYLKRL